MSEINKETIKNFAEKLSKKQVSIRNEEGKGIDIPAPLALLGGALMFTPAVVGSVAAMAMGYKLSVNDSEEADKKDEEKEAAFVQGKKRADGMRDHRRAFAFDGTSPL